MPDALLICGNGSGRLNSDLIELVYLLTKNVESWNSDSHSGGCPTMHPDSLTVGQVRGSLFCGVYKSVAANPGGYTRMSSDLIEIVHCLMKNVESWILV